MQNRSFTKKSWLKTSYEEESYEPVLVIREIDSIRSLVVDDYGDIDKNQEYQVETSMLISRGEYHQISDLQQLPFINYPQILQKLSQTSGPDKLQSKKYISIGKNIKVDMNHPYQNTNTKPDSQLQNFYKQQITSLLNPNPNPSCKSQQKIIMIISEQNTNPHYYLNTLFQYFNNNRHLWQHEIKLDKIHIILQKLLSDVSLECKIGFAQNVNKQNDLVTNTMFMHLKPYLPIIPRYKFAISQKLMSITNTKKFHKIYKGPIPIDSQTTDDQLQVIIDAFTSLGIEIKIINSIFKLLSIIANLNALKVVDSQIQISNLLKDQMEIKAVFPQLNDDNLANICSLLQMRPQKIEDLILDPSVEQPLVSPTKQNSSKSQSCLEKKYISNYKLHIFKFILYEMFITKICDIINKKLFSHQFINEALVRNNQFSNKYLIVLSYGVFDKYNSSDLYPNEVLDQLDDEISQRISKKLLNIMKDSIIQTITYDNQSQTNKLHKQKHQKITTDYFFPTKNAKQKIEQLQNHISYKSSLQNEINSLNGFFTSRILSARKIDSLKKQLEVYNLYCKMSEFMIFSQISMKLFFDTTKKAILKELPYTFYGHLWNVANKEELQQIQDLIVITNNKFLIDDQKFVGKIQKKVLKQINNRKSKKILKDATEINQANQNNNNEQKISSKQENINEPLKSLNQSKNNNQKYETLTRKSDKKVIEKQAIQPLKDAYQSKSKNNNLKEERKIKQQQKKQQNIPQNKQKFSKEQEKETKSPEKSKQRSYQKTHLYSSQKINSKTNQPQAFSQTKPEQIPNKQKVNIKDQIQDQQNQKTQNKQDQKKNNQKNESNSLEKKQAQIDQIKTNQEKEPKIQNLKKEEILEKNMDFKKKPNNQIIYSEPIKQKQQNKQQNQVNKNQPLQQKKQNQKQSKPPNIITASPRNSLQPQKKSLKNEKQVDRTKLSNENFLNQKQKQKMNAKSEFLTSPRPIKKNQNQFIQKSQNLEQLSRQQLTSLKDRPNYTLQQWQKKSKLKFLTIKQQNKCLFTKYGSMSQRISAKIYKSPKPAPDEQILTTFLQFNYLDCTKKILDCNDDEQTQNRMLSNEGINKMYQPLLKSYPINDYPDYYKSAFNSILKIGQQKNTTRSLQKLLNEITQPLIKSYYEQIQLARNIFDQVELIPCSHTSHHNAIKDQIFLYFVKQITTDKHDKLPQNCMISYLFGLSVLTRYYCPSPVFLYPFTHYIYFIHKFAIQKNRDKVYISHLESIFQNLLFFIEATQGFKRNPVNAFIQHNNQQKIFKNQLECAEYLHLRKTPITQLQLNKPPKGQKPQPPIITIWLVNNESFMFPIRNQIVRTLKKKVLSQIGYLDREQCFSLYYLQPNFTYTMIDQKQKVINLLTQTHPNKPKQQRRSIYLRITYYFPFVLKDLNTLRLVYMNLISDQILLPWKGDKYQYVVAQSMAYEDYQQLRIGNYLLFTGQMNNNAPNLNPIQQKLKNLYQEAQNKVCEYEYMKYMKQMHFFLMKCFRSVKIAGYFVGVKPLQIVIYEADHLISSIQIKRVKNVYLVDQRVVLQLYYKNTLAVGKQQQYERLRTLTIQNIQKIQQLFKTILFYLQNSLHTQT